jgi:hypothetical protein
MTQSDLNCAVARATGESLSMIAHMGFVPLTPSPVEREPLVVDRDQLGSRRVRYRRQQPRRRRASA